MFLTINCTITRPGRRRGARKTHRDSLEMFSTHFWSPIKIKCITKKNYNKNYNLKNSRMCNLASQVGKISSAKKIMLFLNDWMEEWIDESCNGWMMDGWM